MFSRGYEHLSSLLSKQYQTALGPITKTVAPVVGSIGACKQVCRTCQIDMNLHAARGHEASSNAQFIYDETILSQTGTTRPDVEEILRSKGISS